MSHCASFTPWRGYGFLQYLLPTAATEGSRLKQRSGFLCRFLIVPIAAHPIFWIELYRLAHLEKHCARHQKQLLGLVEICLKSDLGLSNSVRLRTTGHETILCFASVDEGGQIWRDLSVPLHCKPFKLKGSSGLHAAVCTFDSWL